MVPFENVVAEHGPLVLRVCRAVLGPGDADDAWSETFIAAMRAYPDLAAGADVRAWLVTIARRKAIDQVRRAARAPQPTDDLPEIAGSDVIPDPADEDLRAALGALTPRQRTAVISHHVAGLTYSEVGVLLGSSEAAARRSAADGIARIRQRYTRGGQP